MRYYVYHFMSGLYFEYMYYERLGDERRNPYPVYTRIGKAHAFKAPSQANEIIKELKEIGHHCIIEGVKE